MALPLPVISPQPDAYQLAPHRIKRCTFRRLIDVEAASERVYDVECLFPDRKFPIPLGVYRNVSRPTYDQLLQSQIETSKSKPNAGNLQALLASGDTWTVE